MTPKDDTVVVDLSTYKERFGQRVPEGRYRVVVEAAEATVAKTNAKGIEVWLNVIEPVAYEGTTLTERLYYADGDGKLSKAAFRLVSFMQAIGLPTPRRRFNLNLRQFVGKVLDVDVEDGDPYTGASGTTIRSEVRGFMRVDGAVRTTAASGASDLEDVDYSGLNEFAGGGAPQAWEQPAAEPEQPTLPVDAGTAAEPTPKKGKKGKAKKADAPAASNGVQQPPWDSSAAAIGDEVDLDALDL